jgi:hypothetical protein
VLISSAGRRRFESAASTPDAIVDGWPSGSMHQVSVRVAGGRQASLRDGKVAMERDAAGLRAGSITYPTSTQESG